MKKKTGGARAPRQPLVAMGVPERKLLIDKRLHNRGSKMCGAVLPGLEGHFAESLNETGP